MLKFHKKKTALLLLFWSLLFLSTMVLRVMAIWASVTDRWKAQSTNHRCCFLWIYQANCKVISRSSATQTEGHSGVCLLRLFIQTNNGFLTIRTIPVHTTHCGCPHLSSNKHSLPKYELKKRLVDRVVCMCVNWCDFLFFFFSSSYMVEPVLS